MPHARQQIRESVETLLTGLTTTGTNVYSSRVYPMETFPCLAIYTLDESVTDITMEGFQTRRLNLVVEGRVKATSDLDDTLDDISAEVETALIADQDLSGTIKILELSETEIELADDLEKPAGIVRLFFNVIYRVNENDPTTLID